MRRVGKLSWATEETPMTTTIMMRPEDMVGPAGPLATLEAHDISAWFGTRQVLDRVSLTMHAGHVTALIDSFSSAGIPTEQLAMHFHDTYGQALTNVLAALRSGVTTYDASAGGLGGCPYAESATGNLATEDLVWFLTGLGIDHGVDLDALVRVSVWMAEQLGRPSPSRVVQALASADD